jgi:hypothetical protein
MFQVFCYLFHLAMERVFLLDLLGKCNCKNWKSWWDVFEDLEVHLHLFVLGVMWNCVLLAVNEWDEVGLEVSVVVMFVH